MRAITKSDGFESWTARICAPDVCNMAQSVRFGPGKHRDWTTKTGVLECRLLALTSALYELTTWLSRGSAMRCRSADRHYRTGCLPYHFFRY